MSHPKELYFFTEQVNWSKGLDWYKSWFSDTTKIRGESTTIYTAYPNFNGVAERMHATLPEAKLIYLVRDPIDRLLSHYSMYTIDGSENRTLAEALQDPKSKGYIDRSRYFMQLEQYLAYYPASSILVIKQEALRNYRRETLRRIFKFLGIDPNFYDLRFGWERNRTNHRRRKTKTGLWLEKTSPMRLLQRIPAHLRWPIEDLVYWPFSHSVKRPLFDDSLLQGIREYLRGDVNRLRAFTGENFEEWSV